MLFSYSCKKKKKKKSDFQDHVTIRKTDIPTLRCGHGREAGLQGELNILLTVVDKTSSKNNRDMVNTIN